MMLASLVILGCVIATTFAGEVGSLGYRPKPGFNWYRTPTKSDGRRITIGVTPNSNAFYLKIDYRRNSHYSRGGLFRGSSISSYDYQNIVQVYYGSYLLDNLEVPAIDTMEDDPMSAIGTYITKSIIPYVPNPDTDSPGTIVVYYAFLNGNCVKGTYSHVNNNGEYYEKHYADQVVARSICA